ncbi:MAG: tRNA lysidine(34) synthetase TilS [Planctomycetes bacterium]|nr:tRNA lysidine(34) synthetase TilS [Planctomycetota bacterium]
MKLLDRVRATVAEHEMLAPKDRVVVGVSGGPDSVALVSSLQRLSEEDGLRLKLYVCHLNHKTRGAESDADARFVYELSRQLDLPCLSSNDEEAEERSEEAMRNRRFRYFKERAREVKATRLALGHHRDDRIETILHRVIRGTGILGLRGIPARRPLQPEGRVDLIRPLIDVTRPEIESWLAEQGLTHRKDSSNSDTHYFRNRVRLELLPLLERNYNPNVREALFHLGEIAAQSSECLQAAAHARFKEIALTSGDPTVVSLDLELLGREPAAIRSLLALEAVRHVTGEFREISFRQVQDVLAVGRGEEGTALDLADGVRVQREGARLRFLRVGVKEVVPIVLDEAIRIPGTMEIPHFNLKVETKVMEREGTDLSAFLPMKKPDQEYMDLDKLTHPLRLRTRRPGDAFIPLGMRGTKKVKDFLSDNKVPADERDKIPILVMDDHPIWVVGYRIDNRVRITRKTSRILEIRVKPADRN